MGNERVLNLHYPTGCPYWKKGEYRVELPGGEFLDMEVIGGMVDTDGKITEHFRKYRGPAFDYEVYIEGGDVFFINCVSCSGLGKKRYGEPIKIVSRMEYDRIEYVGVLPVMPIELINDLIENEIYQ